VFRRWLPVSVAVGRGSRASFPCGNVSDGVHRLPAPPLPSTRSYFTVNSTSGQVTVWPPAGAALAGGPFDYDTGARQFVVMVTVTDSGLGLLSTTAAVTVSARV
jgi:hypothetical protein